MEKREFSAHCRRETEKKNTNVFRKDTSLFSIVFIIFDYNIQIFWQLDINININDDMEDDDDDIVKDLFIDDAEFIS